MTSGSKRFLWQSAVTANVVVLLYFGLLILASVMLPPSRDDSRFTVYEARVIVSEFIVPTLSLFALWTLRTRAEIRHAN
jgi:hypothetical protein